MTNFFEKKDRWGHGLAIYVVAFMVFIAPLCWTQLKYIDLENDVENWLPKDDPQAITLDWYLSHFPNEETIFVTWEGSSIDDPRIKLLERKLEGIEDEQGIAREGLEYVDRVSTPQEGLKRILNQKVEQDEAIRRMTGLLIGRGPLKVELTETGSKRKDQTIEDLKQKAKAELGLDITVLDAFATPETDFTDENYALLDTILAEQEAKQEEEGDDYLEDVVIEIPDHDFQVTFQGIDYSPEKVAELEELIRSLRSPSSDNLPEGESLVKETFFAPGSPVAVLVRLNHEGEENKEFAIHQIREIIETCQIPEDKLHIGGRTVASAALNLEVLKAAHNGYYPWSRFWKRSPILTSMLVGVVLSFLMLRSVRLAVLVLFSAVYTMFVTLSLVPATNGSMNMVLVVMPTLLMVLTMSGAIHVANYWKHAAVKTPENAVPNAVRMAFKPCLLASVTTALGLMSLGTSPLVPVEDFGIYSAVGCIISFGVILYGMPALLQFWPSRNVRIQKVNSRPWQKLGGWIYDYSTPIALCTLAIGIGLTVGLKNFSTETKVIRYFPEDSQVVQDYHFIEGNLVHIVPVDTIVKFTAEAREEMTFIERMEVVRDLEDKIRNHPEISGTISLADLFEEETEIVEPDPENERGERLKYSLFARRANKTEREVLKGQDESGSRLISAAIGEGEELPTDVSPNHFRMSNPDEELWRITAQVAIMSDLDYADLTVEIDEMAKSVLKLHPASHVVTGMVPIFLRTQQAVLESLIVSFALAFAMIAVMMMFVLKDVISGLLTMLPNLWPVGAVFGAISWGGLDVDIGTMITASVALGVAVDGTLHFLTWFREGIAEGKSRRDSIALAMGHCAPAMWQTSMAVGLGMFMLSFADLLLVSRFGWLMAVLIASALIADLVLLPAMLAGTLGGFIARRVRPEDQDDAMNLDEEQAAQTEDASKQPVPEPHLQAFSDTKSAMKRSDPGLSPNS